MDQYNSNSQNEFLWTLLAHPANDAYLYAYNLQRLVNDFPQSGLLQAMLAHASDEKNLKRASVYFNPKSLYKLVNAPSSFIGVSDEKIIIQNAIRSNGYHHNEYLPVAEDQVTYPNQIDDHHHNNYFTEPPVAKTIAEATPPVEDHQQPEAIEPAVHHFNDELKQIEESPLPLEQAVENTIYEAAPAEHNYLQETAASFIEPEINNKAEIAAPAVEQPAEKAIEADKQEHNTQTETQQPGSAIEEDTFDEIGNADNFSIDHNTGAPEAIEHKEAVPPPVFELKAEEIKDEPVDFDDETEKLITGSIASSDYFMFDNALGKNKPVEQVENEEPVSFKRQKDLPDVQSFLKNDIEQQDVSKYHDEKMPYTFMWWLDKTRKEHSGIYQPYIKNPDTVTEPQSNGRVKKPADELQQQYYENIFHITSVEELDKATAPKAPAAKPEIKRKEQIIIERFIQEEPQIKPQSSDKLDNENKAKKSSEDRDELVTETLASIYSEQMLYHKAIASYKKLMLKFPEKSRYFAGKIEQLEKKTN